MTKVLFLDESGDHNLSVIDPAYPMFVLGGVIMDKAYAQTTLTEKMNTLKQELFGRTDIILHTADITRNKNGFERMKEPEFRETFYKKINAFMENLEYQVVACVVKKEEHLSRYGVAALDPYLLSLDILVERLGFEVGIQKQGIIVAEKRDSTLDNQLELAWLNLKVQGTRFLSATDVKNRIASLNMRAKSENIAGLQLADLVVSPIGRKVLGKPCKKDWEIIERKFRTNNMGKYYGFGLVVLPKN